MHSVPREILLNSKREKLQLKKGKRKKKKAKLQTPFRTVSPRANSSQHSIRKHLSFPTFFLRTTRLRPKLGSTSSTRLASRSPAVCQPALSAGSCERRIIDNGKNQTRFLSEDCSLPEADTSMHSDNSEQSAQDLTGPGPESIAPNVQSLPEGKTECITGGLSPQSPSRSSYRAPQGATRKAQVDGIRLSSRRACRAAAGQNSPSPLRASTRRGDESFLRSAYEKTAFDHKQYLGDQLRC